MNMTDAELLNYWNANKDQPEVIQAKLDELGRTVDDLATLTGEDVTAVLQPKAKRVKKAAD
jgi:antitoxin component HigA of HigAB toxin-antitoxin module